MKRGARGLDEDQDKGLSAGLWGNRSERGCREEGGFGYDELQDPRDGKYMSDDGDENCRKRHSSTVSHAFSPQRHILLLAAFPLDLTAAPC